MIKLNIKGTRIDCANISTFVEGNINSELISFAYSDEWKALHRIAIFCNGKVKIAVNLPSDICAIPWEVLTEPGDLYISLRGIGGSGNFVLFTEKLFLGKIVCSSVGGALNRTENATPDIIDTLIADVARLKACCHYFPRSDFDGASEF